MTRQRRRECLLIVVIVLGSMSHGLLSPMGARADDTQPPSRCPSAPLAPLPPPIARRPHLDGRYTPILLVHGFIGNPAMWSAPIDHTTLPVPVESRRSLLANLQRLQGAAVYTLDYHDVAKKWFTNDGAGGSRFLAAEACLSSAAAFRGHKLVVVAHSMGGLITRWAVSDAAPGGVARRARISLVITLGTPYEGAWLARVATLLGDAATTVARSRTPSGAMEGLAVLVHLLVRQCSAQPTTPGCAELTGMLDRLGSIANFSPGRLALRALADWPRGIQVETLGSRSVLENAAGDLFFAAPARGDLDLGDGVVAVGSATAGNHPAKVATCRYTGSRIRAGADSLLGSWGLKSLADQRTYQPLVTALFGTAFTICGHAGEARLIQLTNEVLGAVADQLQGDDARRAESPTELRQRLDLMARAMEVNGGTITTSARNKVTRPLDRESMDLDGTCFGANGDAVFQFQPGLHRELLRKHAR